MREAKTIIMSEILEKGCNTFSKKDNSVRGCSTVNKEELKIGDKIIIDNYFTLITE